MSSRSSYGAHLSPELQLTNIFTADYSVDYFFSRIINYLFGL